MWLIYGIAIQAFLIWFPSCVGLFLSIIQLVLVIMYTPSGHVLAVLTGEDISHLSHSNQAKVQKVVSRLGLDSSVHASSAKSIPNSYDAKEAQQISSPQHVSDEI